MRRIRLAASLYRLSSHRSWCPAPEVRRSLRRTKGISRPLKTSWVRSQDGAIMSDTSWNPPAVRGPRPRTSWVWFVVLGVLQILLGVFAWFDVLAATIAATFLIGIALLLGGVFQALHSFLDRSWGGFILHLLAGILYIFGGL